MNGSFNVTETSFFLFMIVLIDLVQNYSVLKLNMWDINVISGLQNEQ